MLTWESFVGCKAISEQTSLQVGCSTLNTTLNNSDWSRSHDNSALFSVVLSVEQPTCKLASSEMALQPTNEFRNQYQWDPGNPVSPNQPKWGNLTLNWWYVARQATMKPKSE